MRKNEVYTSQPISKYQPNCRALIFIPMDLNSMETPVLEGYLKQGLGLCKSGWYWYLTENPVHCELELPSYIVLFAFYLRGRNEPMSLFHYYMPDDYYFSFKNTQTTRSYVILYTEVIPKDQKCQIIQAHLQWNHNWTEIQNGGRNESADFEVSMAQIQIAMNVLLSRSKNGKVHHSPQLGETNLISNDLKFIQSPYVNRKKKKVC